MPKVWSKANKECPTLQLHKVHKRTKNSSLNRNRRNIWASAIHVWLQWCKNGHNNCANNMPNMSQPPPIMLAWQPPYQAIDNTLRPAEHSKPKRIKALSLIFCYSNSTWIMMYFLHERPCFIHRTRWKKSSSHVFLLRYIYIYIYKYIRIWWEQVFFYAGFIECYAIGGVHLFYHKLFQLSHITPYRFI